MDIQETTASPVCALCYLWCDLFAWVGLVRMQSVAGQRAELAPEVLRIATGTFTSVLPVHLIVLRAHATNKAQVIAAACRVAHQGVKPSHWCTAQMLVCA